MMIVFVYTLGIVCCHIATTICKSHHYLEGNFLHSTPAFLKYVDLLQLITECATPMRHTV